MKLNERAYEHARHLIADGTLTLRPQDGSSWSAVSAGDSQRETFEEVVARIDVSQVEAVDHADAVGERKWVAPPSPIER